ncbi:hypothetical protein GCM10023183_11460 [Nibribacter koreensis]|uniref:Cytochrome C and Quinol oxidase polypeptide I n=2 Tax=Nibribacter koreensis TaxID=1084519 RepID=A0ABP8FD97_9BACT
MAFSIHSKKVWLMAALLQLVVVAFLGLGLRFMLLEPLAGLNFKYILHAHSHAALLGWLYSAVFVALLLVFLPPELSAKKTYTWQFWLSQGAVLGMLFTFPVQGYAAVSIAFSTAHILLSYWFIYQFLKDARTVHLPSTPYRLAFRFVKAALFFLALSSLGPWAMGPIMATGQSGTNLYFNAIYFYLHFQYNGWFTFAGVGLLFWFLARHEIMISHKVGNTVFYLLFRACFPAYLLSVLWIKPAAWVYWTAGVAGAVQLIGSGLLARLIWLYRNQLLAFFRGWAKALFLMSVAALGLKMVLQMATAFPYVANLAYQLRYFIIGYLHLVLIGGVSFFLFSFFAQRGWWQFSTFLAKWGMGFFVFGFLSTEALLFAQGTLLWLRLGAVPLYHLWLFLGSVFLAAGILLIFMSQKASLVPSGAIIPKEK